MLFRKTSSSNPLHEMYEEW